MTPRRVMPADVASSGMRRYGRAFANLSSEDFETLGALGRARVLRDGQVIAGPGVDVPGLCLVISGRLCVEPQDALAWCCDEIGVGGFLAALTAPVRALRVQAVGRAQVLWVEVEPLERLLAGDAALCGSILHALLLRALTPNVQGEDKVILVGSQAASAILRLSTYLAATGQSYVVINPETNSELVALVDHFGTAEVLAVTPDGTVLETPSEAELDEAIGLLNLPDPDRIFDVCVVGAGPSGLSAALRLAADGYDTVLLDGRGLGGLANLPGRTADPPGFPGGVQSDVLMARMALQSERLGVRALIPAQVVGLDAEPVGLAFRLRGATVRARAGVIACGAAYEPPDVPDWEQFEGKGLWFGLSDLERRVGGQAGTAVMIGALERAGPAALMVARRRRVTLMASSQDLKAAPPDLRERLIEHREIDLVLDGRVAALEADAQGCLASLSWRSRDAGALQGLSTGALFVFCRMTPATAWLQAAGVACDGGGFILPVDSASLATTLKGLFVTGDVRAGSTKSVGSAMADGASVALAVQDYLSP